MAAQGYVGFDPTAPPGQKFPDPAVRAEVARLAPTSPPDGSIGAAKLAPEAVLREKIRPGAVGAAQVEDASLPGGKLVPATVGTTQLADAAVTRLKAGIGVVTARDTSGNPVKNELLTISSTDHAALGANEDPNTTYLIYDT